MPDYTAQVTPPGGGPHGDDPYTVTLRECEQCKWLYANLEAHLRDSLPHIES